MDSEFLYLCGFEPDEIKKESPRIDKTFNILGLGDEDIERAKARICKYLDIELLGMRKTIGLWIKELADMVLAKEEGKKVVYVSYPPISQISAAISLTYDDIYCASPDIVLSNTLNLMFDRINPILETAERNGLAPGIAFCSYLQTRLGSIVQGIVPHPDLLIPSCFLCDLTPATDQLIQYFYGTPVAYIDNMIDDKGEGWPDEINPRKIGYFSTELRNIIDTFNRVMGKQLTETQAREAVNMADKLISASIQIGELRTADPLPLGQNDLFLSMSIGSVKRGLIEGPGVMKILTEETQNRVDSGKGIVKKGAPRVMMVMQPHDPSLVALITELGLASGVASQVTRRRGAFAPEYSDLWESVTVAHLRSRGANYSSLAYINQLKESISQAHVDGIIFFRHYSCRQYSIFPIKAKEVIEKELGVRVLLLEGDYCDFRSYNTQQMRTKLETFAEIVKADRAAKERAK